MSMDRGFPKRPPIYGENGEEENDEEHASRGEGHDVNFPRSGSRGLI